MACARWPTNTSLRAEVEEVKLIAEFKATEEGAATEEAVAVVITEVVVVDTTTTTEETVGRVTDVVTDTTKVIMLRMIQILPLPCN